MRRDLTPHGEEPPTGPREARPDDKLRGVSNQKATEPHFARPRWRSPRRLDSSERQGSASDFAAQHGSEQFPCLAFELPEPDLLDRCEIDRAGVDRNAGQKVRGPE